MGIIPSPPSTKTLYAMGLIRDAIGTALGSDQVANGFNGPKLPFGNKGSSIRDMRRSALSSPSRQGYISEISYQNDRGLYPPEDMQRGMARQQGYNGYQNRGPPLPPRCEPPPYASDNQSWYQEEPYNGQRFDEQPYNGQRFDEQSYYQQGPVRDMGYPRDMGYSSRDAGFRPIALPQISYGDGQPFLRGYSNELSRYGISEAEFIRLVDAINVAIIPSPENQIFQKGANIAGWFV
ncbi:hypothetical protein N7466_001826 [Penicillium verhagenii]|uniref:uncharacterized protein n=1 Tax=Penicillium verhagenii TaxID=1562060 RepID=UPI0025454859|nr:uncharacterized protein N7466_001826 [Penicillium verhagenii]KAJ5938692.1 hypothetical protein N7466_001826 [Penicillium verhagenii]